ncbi:hypothetical protein PTKIN_Ptkin10aG0055000 [Pterospermum kingtungense]
MAKFWKRSEIDEGLPAMADGYWQLINGCRYELSFRLNVDVVMEESPDCFKFIIETDRRIDDVVKAYMVEIHHGVTKIIRRSNSLVDFTSLDDLELDMWWFRLPNMTRSELVSFVYEDGEAIEDVGEEEETIEALKLKAGQVVRPKVHRERPH